MIYIHITPDCVTKLLKHLDARPRLLISVLVSVLACILLPSWMLLPTRIVVTWNIGTICFLILAWVMINNATPQGMRRSAQREDSSRLTVLILVVAAACMSLLAITFMLQGGKSLPARILALHVIFAVITIVSSWLLIHTMFALQYAHYYYRDRREDTTISNAEGLDFPQDKQPDYWDFLYFSFVVGMTCQVSDVQITSSLMRRLALVHGIVTFFFNTVILALSINIIAALL